MLKPHGGKLINKIANTEEKKELLKKVEYLKKLVISDRYVSDCEMIANGGFSPLNGFMTKEDVEEVINNLHLKNGLLWSIPIVLPVPDDIYNSFTLGDEVAFYDRYNRPIAIMVIEDKFKLDLENYCKNVFKTNDLEHPGVKVVKKHGNNFIGGEIVRLLNRPIREGIDSKYYMDPSEVRKNIEQRG